MKRRFLSRSLAESITQISEQRNDYTPPPIPEGYDDLKRYAHRLRLLNDIPLTYLLTDLSDLKEESIKFGMVDINWTDAYIDGAFSIGRVSNTDARIDKNITNNHFKLKEHKIKYLDTPRMRMMHPNHKSKHTLLNAKNGDLDIDISNISVVLIRSQLIRTKKGLNYLGYDKQSYDQIKKISSQEDDPPKEIPSLPILRIEKLSDDIMICLFSGIIDTFIIEEPMTGVKFGCDTEWNIDLRSTKEDKNFGSPLKDGDKNIQSKIKFIDENGQKSIEENGKIHPQIIANKIKEDYNNRKDESLPTIDNITPSIFAFEMLDIPHKAVFSASELPTTTTNRSENG